MSTKTMVDQQWPVKLFRKSVLKQNKFTEILALLGDTSQQRCLDIGADNGVISYLLRQRGGQWKSADLDPEAIRSIQALVKEEVFQIDGEQTPFSDNEFDRVVIVDFLEHIPTDKAFLDEVFRILKPDGEVIINVPHIKESLLRKFRFTIGQTDEKHGHVKPGYTLTELQVLLKDKFVIVASKTYSRFFSECIDTLITFGVSILKRGKPSSQKGMLVTGQDLKQYQKIFRVYSVIYPLVWLFSKLDTLLYFTDGYRLIVKAKVHK